MRYLLLLASVLCAKEPIQFTASDGIDLERFERSVFSQNGEDGVIDKIFSVIGTHLKYYVEFDALDGHILSNTKLLREFGGWEGLLLDPARGDRTINLHKERITAENINQLFKKYNVPKNFDLLSIDLDYNDFYVWKALKYRPRVVIAEYNASFAPPEDKVVSYDPSKFWDGTDYYGASIQAFYNLARLKGYSLVYADYKGVNLFFVRDDLLRAADLRFKDVNDVAKLYRRPKYGVEKAGGHLRDPQKREFVASSRLLAPRD